MRHFCLASFICLFLPLLASAQGSKVYTWTPPDHLDPPIGTTIRKEVVNIELDCQVQSESRSEIRPVRGTGFLVAFEDPRLPKGTAFHYLVTNRHVAECWDEERKPRQVKSTSIRVNLKDGTSTSIPILGMRWFFPVDLSADIAVTPITPSSTVDYAAIPITAFFERDFFAKYNIAEGAKILLAGYFYQLEGEHRLQPIMREGILSMIPDEPLVTTTGKRGPLYLGDVHIFGGNSGSPVFINIQGSVTLQNGPQLTDAYYLLGIVSGYYYEDSDFNLQIATTVNVKQRANSGVSMIVPSDVLKDLILNNEVLRSERDGYFATPRK
jgi:hypothetical protein